MLVEWEYNDHDNISSVTSRSEEVQSWVANQPNELDKALADTREHHKYIFAHVTPQGYPKFAGHYRGSNIKYLKNRPVFIGEYEGTKPHLVLEQMQKFHDYYLTELQRLKLELTRSKIQPKIKLLVISEIIADFMVTFLAIHPYANGNGHVSRLLVWAVFVKFDFKVDDWDVDIRPPLPFDQLIDLYRKGQERPLIVYFLRMLTIK